jgi:hypothetical protein
MKTATGQRHRSIVLYAEAKWTHVIVNSSLMQGEEAEFSGRQGHSAREWPAYVTNATLITLLNTIEALSANPRLELTVFTVHCSFY